MRFIVQYSGGVGSWLTAKKLIDYHGADKVTLLFADTKMEDEDLYRFLRETVDQFGCELVTIADGRNPWEVFRDKRFIGNTRIDPCSLILKRDLLRAWIDANADPDEDFIALGIDFMEIHRFHNAIERWKPFRLIAPLCTPPYPTKDDGLEMLARVGIAPPRLYAIGFPHNNCGGFCVKAGHAQFALLLRELPERYAWHEEQEELTRQAIGKPVAILRSRVGGRTVPLTLRRFREAREAQQSFDATDWGGCGCAVD